MSCTEATWLLRVEQREKKKGKKYYEDCLPAALDPAYSAWFGIPAICAAMDDVSTIRPPGRQWRRAYVIGKRLISGLSLVSMV